MINPTSLSSSAVSPTTIVRPMAAQGNSAEVPEAAGSFSASHPTVSYAYTNFGLSTEQALLALFQEVSIQSMKMVGDARLDAREHNRFIRESLAHQAELEVEKMLSSALSQLIGGIAQGGLSVLGGLVQIKSSISALKTLQAKSEPLKPKMDAARNAETAFKKAEADLAKAKLPGEDVSSLEEAVRTAEAAKGAANAELLSAMKAFRNDPDVKMLDTLHTRSQGIATLAKGFGEIVEQVMKSESAKDDAKLHLLKAFTQNLQSTQQSNESFERELVDTLKQALDALKGLFNTVHQTSMNTVTYA